jgi:putative ABC transport system substrate-binding protein
MTEEITVLTLCAMFLALSVPAAAQQPGKAARIGYLDSSTVAGSAELLDEFRRQMTQLNWIEGKNLTIAYRFAEGKGAKRLAELSAELVRLKLDLIVVTATGPALAAKKATSAIPIVMVSVGDPVERGLITSLAYPGENITGLATFAEELAGKRVEILKEVLPKSTKMGVITGGSGIGGERQVKAMKAVASALGLKLGVVGTASDAEKLVKTFSNNGSRASQRHRYY